MLDRTARYQKSAKGADAIAHRAPGFPPRLRSVLIMVDGKRTAAELIQVAAALGNGEQLVEQLATDGLIETVAGTSPPTRPSAASPSADTTITTVPLPEARRWAVRRLTDLMGPTAEQLCLRIESARNTQEFNVAIRNAEKVLHQFGGAEMAAGFIAHVQARPPA